jgi:Ala-tRNA(Pro) deacylase
VWCCALRSLDLDKVRDRRGDGKAPRLATEDELGSAYPMFELGAVPPFGGPAGDHTIVDRLFAEQEWVVIVAGSHTESLRITMQDLLSLTDAGVADICAD